MKRMTRILTLALAAAAPIGCDQNAVYFYETHKLALNLEARPDSTSPISGSLGLKQRVVAFVPSTQASDTDVANLVKLGQAAAELNRANAIRQNAITDESNEQAVKAQAEWEKALAALDKRDPTGNAMSVLSTFRFTKDDVGLFGTIHIDSALITGKTACLVADKNRSLEAIGALSGATMESVDALMLHAGLLYDQINSGDLQYLKAQAAEALTALDNLASQAPSEFDFIRYSWQSPNLKSTAVGQAITDAGFAKVKGYRFELHESIRQLSAAIAAIDSGKVKLSDLKLDGQAAPEKVRDTLASNRLALMEKLKSLDREIAPKLRAAITRLNALL